MQKYKPYRHLAPSHTPRPYLLNSKTCRNAAFKEVNLCTRRPKSQEGILVAQSPGHARLKVARKGETRSGSHANDFLLLRHLFQRQRRTMRSRDLPRQSSWLATTFTATRYPPPCQPAIRATARTHAPRQTVTFHARHRTSLRPHAALRGILYQRRLLTGRARRCSIRYWR